jgi:S-layer homology domain
MSKTQWKALALSLAAVLTTIILVITTTATTTFAQITSISQFSDVRPTDYNYQALQSLTERYGCMVGYPDGTFRGNKSLTRGEFAGQLNACLDRMQELIATETADTPEKIDNLESRLIQLQLKLESIHQTSPNQQNQPI